MKRAVLRVTTTICMKYDDYATTTTSTTGQIKFSG